jgi:hypothetical protein
MSDSRSLPRKAGFVVLFASLNVLLNAFVVLQVLYLIGDLLDGHICKTERIESQRSIKISRRSKATDSIQPRENLPFIMIFYKNNPIFANHFFQNNV